MIFIDSELETPLYMQIYEQFKSQIITKEIPKGSKLPSIRSLSLTLDVSRNTVETAYMQLSSEGYIESKPGSGFIALELESMELIKLANKDSEYIDDTRSTRVELDENDNYKYNFNNRCISAEEFPLTTWRKISNQCLSSNFVENFMDYNAKWGDYGLQVQLAKYLKKARGVSCKPEQIIISCGLEYSLSLLCQLFREDFDNIAIEDPGYMEATDIFINHGYKVSPISLNRDGINVDELSDSSAKMVYVTPSHQFPMGTVLPIKKRLKLLDWARKNHGYIIEDDYDSEFRYKSKPIPSLQSIDSLGCVIYMGSFSKSLSPTIRISYMILPESLLERYNKLFNWYHITVSFMQQKILQQFMEQGHWDRHLRKVHLNAIRKHELLIRSIEKYMGYDVIIHGKNSGLHILLEFKNGMNEEELIKKAKQSGVQVLPVSTFWVNKDNYSKNMIMLAFGGVALDEIESGIKALSEGILGVGPWT